MYNKTTNFTFDKYGIIINNLTKSKSEKLDHRLLKFKNKTVDEFLVYTHDIYIRTTDGIAMLVITNDVEADSYDKFVIHRTIKIKAGVFFNFISISKEARVDIISDPHCGYDLVPSPMDKDYTYEPIISTFNVSEIFAYFYQVRNSHYTSPEENNSLWELTYIDNGSLNTCIDNEKYVLNNFDIVLTAPNQVHTQDTANRQSCSYFTIIFDMHIDNPEVLTNRVFKAQKETQAIINNFMKASSSNNEYANDLLICYLKELLIKLINIDNEVEVKTKTTKYQHRFENELLNEIILYINENIYETLTIDELTKKFSLSRSSLQNLFNENLGIAPKLYVSNLKLGKAKQLISEGTYSISEIACMLGYTSIHYFSRTFKYNFKMTPTDYAKQTGAKNKDKK